jgi:hypothetical protein
LSAAPFSLNSRDHRGKIKSLITNSAITANLISWRLHAFPQPTIFKITPAEKIFMFYLLLQIAKTVDDGELVDLEGSRIAGVEGRKDGNNNPTSRLHSLHTIHFPFNGSAGVRGESDRPKPPDNKGPFGLY